MRILCVDDDAQIRELLRDLLESHGHAVIEAGTLLEGLAILASRMVEVAIVDGAFPKDRTSRCLGAFGPVLTSEARALGVRTLLLSGDDALVEREQRAGFPAMKKPFEIHALLAAIEQPIGAAT